MSEPRLIALLGNPNCGKTSLFNRLTGAKQKVANYAGATVERKEGRLTLPSGRMVTLLDLPGAYSLSATSPDEAITRAVCMGEFPGEAKPDLLLCVVDATNLRLHLRFVLEVQQLGLPMIVVLNMMDAAKRRGIHINSEQLALRLGLPVVETVALSVPGIQSLLAELETDLPPAPEHCVSSQNPLNLHAEVTALLAATVTMPRSTDARDDALDKILLHPLGGLAILITILFFMFQAVFAWAKPLMAGIQDGMGVIADFSTSFLSDGLLKSLLLDGIFAGVGGVLVFLPQILILFAFILVLEESGYLPRAAFLLDKLMFKAGLTGRAFIPLLSSFACAIPGIMATRSISDPRDRLATIMVAPLMTCSARLPVYTLLIAAFIPYKTIGLFNLQGLVLFALYVMGIVSALAVAWFMKKWRNDTGEHALLLELPSYRMPDWKSVLLGLLERGKIFVKRVGGIILALTILMWFLATFPGAPVGSSEPAINYSFVGIIGHFIAPLFVALGFTWQICVALIPGMAAREVVVAALGTVYAVSDSQGDLAPILHQQWSVATGLALLVWFIYAPQCLSTLATVRRETNSWRITLIMTTYLFGLAYGMAFLTYQITRALS